MGELNSKFSREDLEVLIEAIGDWEALGNQEWTIAQMVKAAPLPPEEHETFGMMSAIKDHFRQRERLLNQNRQERQEKAVFLKAKLMLVRKDMEIDSLFSIPTESDLPIINGSEAARRLHIAESFIKDLGVELHYQKYLSEQNSE